jgi:hypothetical protein
MSNIRIRYYTDSNSFDKGENKVASFDQSDEFRVKKLF